jgi:hypothetical protein
MSLLFGNFDFEHHLGRSGTRTLPAHVQQINAELAYSLVAIAQPGDLLWTTAPPESDYKRRLAGLGLPDLKLVSDPANVPAGTNLVPWGWSRQVKEWATPNGWRCESPDLDIVATANSREFSSSLEREWNVGLPQARTIHSLPEFHSAIEESARENADWGVKANYGMSARERILGRGSPPSSDAVKWVRKQLAQSEAVYFEPWVEPIEERGIQFTIPPAGEPILEGITPLLTDNLGTYRGSRLPQVGATAVADDDTADFLPTVTRAAKRIQQLGYFGPLGIDAMRYRTADGESRWRPLQDINARLTMGRLALGLRHLVAKSQYASWLHVRGSSNAQMGEEIGPIPDLLPKGTRIVRTSPNFNRYDPARPIVFNLARRVSFLVTAPTIKTLLVAEAFCFGTLR